VRLSLEWDLNSTATAKLERFRSAVPAAVRFSMIAEHMRVTCASNFTRCTRYGSRSESLCGSLGSLTRP